MKAIFVTVKMELAEEVPYLLPATKEEFEQALVESIEQNSNSNDIPKITAEVVKYVGVEFKKAR